MSNSCNITSIKATLLSGNDFERILILVFLVLRDAGTFSKISFCGLNLISPIQFTSQMRLHDHYYVLWLVWVLVMAFLIVSVIFGFVRGRDI